MRTVCFAVFSYKNSFSHVLFSEWKLTKYKINIATLTYFLYSYCRVWLCKEFSPLWNKLKSSDYAVSEKDSLDHFTQWTVYFRGGWITSFSTIKSLCRPTWQTLKWNKLRLLTNSCSLKDWKSFWDGAESNWVHSSTEPENSFVLKYFLFLLLHPSTHLHFSDRFCTFSSTSFVNAHNYWICRFSNNTT